jgi:hypothetical protein
VREQLPEAKADEIISELRGYMIEMTEALSDGTMTTTSAKKVVARFGAPSELAKEYSSDFPESDMEEFDQEFDEDLPEQQEDVSPARYTTTFLKFVTITMLWLVICWISVTPFAYWWMGSLAIFAPVLQFGGVTIAFSARLLGFKIKKLQLRNVSFKNWSGFQKWVTLPENLTVETNRVKVLADIGLTILAALGFVAFNNYRDAAFLMFFSFPTWLFLLVHLHYAIRRFRNSDPASFIRREYVVNIGLVLLLNVMIAWGFYPWRMGLAGSVFLVWISLGYSMLILYQIATRMQDLWWAAVKIPDGYSEKSSKLSPEAKRKMLDQTKRTALRTIGGIGATFSAIVITIPLMLFITQTSIPWSRWNTHGIFIVLFVSFAALVSVGLASGYFGTRYYLIRSRGHTSVFGKRIRVEAVFDLVIIGAALFIVLSSWSYWAGHLVSETIYLTSEANPLFRLLLDTAIVAWGQFLVIAIVARIAADIGNLREHASNFTQEAMAFSGDLFLIDTLLMTGIYIMLLTYLDSYLPILNEMFAIMMLSYTTLILFAFQKSTASIKLKWRKESNRTYQNRQ